MLFAKYPGIVYAGLSDEKNAKICHDEARWFLA